MSRELAIIDLITGLTGQTGAMADDAFWDEASRAIYTTDMLVENRHFSRDYFSPRDLGWKAAAVNISDLAGMGGRLKYLLISLGLPEHLGLDFVRELYQGFQDACQAFGGIIAGGDTVGSPLLTLNVTAIGECPAGSHPGRRFQAQPGDWVLASGYHGLSQVGLLALQNCWPGFQMGKTAHLRPMPRIEAGLTLARKFERYALMDSSDGLADALIKIAQSSGQTLVVERRKIPLHPEVMAYSHKIAANHPTRPVEDIALETALYGGEDFELIATVPPPTSKNMDAEILAHFHVIGRVEAATDTPGAFIKEAGTGALMPLTLGKTYQHFRGNAHE